MKAIWAENTPYSKFLITVGVILVSVVFFTLITTLLATAVYGISMEELQVLISDPSQPVALSILKMLQTLSAIGAFIIPPFLLGYLFDGRPVKFLSLDRRPGVASFVVAGAVMIVSTPLVNFLGEINSYLHLPPFLKGLEEWMHESEDKAAELTEAFLEMKSMGDVFFNLIMIGLIPAVGEELVFRGVVQKIFFQWSRNSHVAIWTTAILFSAIHLQFYGFLPRLVLGGMLGYMYVWSGSLWVPIFGHFINNAGAVILTYLFQQQMTEFNPDEVGTGSDFGSVAISLVITVLLFGYLYRRRTTDAADTTDTTDTVDDSEGYRP